MCIPSGVYSSCSAVLACSQQEYALFVLHALLAAPSYVRCCALLSYLQPDSEKLQKVLDAAQPQIQRVLSS